MAFTDSTLIQAAFKKLFGLAHTEVKDFPLGNEANPTQITIVASDVYGEAIPATASANASRIACTNATNGQADSYLTVAQNLTIAPDGAGEGHAYLVTIPASHGLIGEINPITGQAYAQGDVVMSIIPKKFGSTWRPVLYDSSKVEITPLSSQDWIIDERGFVIIRDNSTAPAYLKCYVYVGTTVQDHIGNTSNPHSVTADQVLPSQTGHSGEYLTTNGTTASWAAVSGGGLSDGDKGDITVSGSGATWTIDNSVVTLAKMADMATASVFYRKTAGTGAPEVQTLATLKTDLGLTGTNSGDQTSIVGITGTKAQFDTAVTDGNFLYVGDITQYTDELAQDAVGAMVDTTLVYTDGTPLLSRAALTGAITASAGSNTTALGSFTKSQLDTAVSDGNVLYVGDITQYTDEMAQDAIGGILTDSTTIDFTYNDAGNTITAIVIDASITLAKMANIATDRLIGRDTAGTGVPEALTVGGGIEFTGSGGIQTSAFTGDVTKTAGGTALTIANDAVTYAKMQNVSATDKVLGRSTAGSGDVEEITCTSFARSILDDANAAATIATLGLDADIATLALPASTTISTFGASLVDDTSATAARTTLGANQLEHYITVENPTNAEDISMFFTNRAITITKMVAVLNNGSSTPSVTWTIRHHTDRSNAGNQVVTGGTATTSVSTGSVVTSFNDATIPQDSFVWLETTAKSGTVPELTITLIYTID